MLGGTYSEIVESYLAESAPLSCFPHHCTCPAQSASRSLVFRPNRRGTCI